MNLDDHAQMIWSNLDKLLLVFLLVTLVGVHVHMVGALGNSVDPTEANQLNWIEGIIGQVLAALLTLLVTQVRQQSKEAKVTITDTGGNVEETSKETQKG